MTLRIRHLPAHGDISIFLFRVSGRPSTSERTPPARPRRPYLKLRNKAVLCPMMFTFLNLILDSRRICTKETEYHIPLQFHPHPHPRHENK